MNPAPHPAAPAAAPAPAADDLLRAVEAARAEVDELAAQLERAGRLALLGTLAATLAHEFNNLLTPGVGYATLALRSLDGPEPDLALVRKALQKAKAGGDKAGRIGRAILALARADAEEGAAAVAECGVAECGVADAVRQAVEAMGREPARDGIALRIDAAPNLRAAVDAVQLEHVLLNLLLNARSAMLGPGGRRGTLEVHAAVETAGPAGFLRIDVSDTGCGIPPADLPHVFEPFYSNRPTSGGVSGGTGLGLHLCRRIVERHGGRIGVQSVVGRGSIFTLRLPAA